MQYYRMVTEVSVPDNMETWGSIYPMDAETLENVLSKKIVSWNYEPLTPSSTRITLYFNTKEDYDAYVAYRESIPEYQERTQYELENNISRVLVSSEYVDIDPLN